MTTVEGHVRLVQFQTFGEWFLSVMLDEVKDGEWPRYQIDGAADYFVDGTKYSKASLVQWFAMRFAHRSGMPRVKITGHFGAYPTCEKAEFFSPEP